ncbi:MAG: LEA type 2 family protein [Cytophagaceae bacterium]|nr:LEA type 2 family protein [Cytophagaceae bacterium]
MKRSPWIWILAVVGLALLGVGGWYYWRLQKTPSEAPGQGLKPELSVMAVDVSDISEEEINLTIRLYLRNPYPVELRARRLDYQVLIDSTKIIENAYTEPLTIQSGDSAVVKLPMKLQADEFKQVMKGIKARKQDSANYTIQAKILADVPVVGERTFNWETTKRMPAYQLPTLRLHGLKVDKLGLNNSKLEAQIYFYNPNVFDIQVRDLRYVLTVGQQDNLHAVATRPGLTRIPSKSETIIPIQIDVELDQAGKFIGQALFAQSKTPLESVATFQFVSDKDFIKGSKLALKLKGTLDEFTKKPVRMPRVP